VAFRLVKKEGELGSPWYPLKIRIITRFNYVLFETLTCHLLANLVYFIDEHQRILILGLL